jgi:hypothetical protein
VEYSRTALTGDKNDTTAPVSQKAEAEYVCGVELAAALGYEVQIIAELATRCTSSMLYCNNEMASPLDEAQLSATVLGLPPIRFSATTTLPPGELLTAVV